MEKVGIIKKITEKISERNAETLRISKVLNGVQIALVQRQSNEEKVKEMRNLL